jgi:hypothetical protein
MGLAFTGLLGMRNAMPLEDLFSRKLKVSGERPAEYQKYDCLRGSDGQPNGQQKKTPIIIRINSY